MISKNLGKGLGEPKILGRIETIQIITLLKSAWIIRRACRFDEICYHVDPSESTHVKTGVKTSHRVKIIMMPPNYIQSRCKGGYRFTKS